MSTGTMAKAHGGFQLVAERDPQAQVVQLQVLIRSGSLSDPEGFPGVSNFTARALLRGTVSRPFQVLTAAIERLGASVAVRVDQDFTVVSTCVLPRNLEPFLDLLRDVLTQPAFDPGEMETLRTTLQGELRSALQDAQELGSRATLRAAFRGTPAERVPEGTIDGISRIQPGQLRDFFRSRYVKKNMVLGVVSPFEDADIASRIASRLASVPDGAPCEVEFPDRGFEGRRAIVVDREGLSTTPVYVAVPGLGDADPDLPALELANFVFGGDFTSRLMQVLRAENGWTYGVSSGFTQLVSPKAKPGLFSVYLFPSAEHAGLAIPKTVAMLDEYVARGLVPEELAKAREALGNAYPFQVATAEQRLALRLREILTGRPYETSERYSRRLAKLELSPLNATIASRTPVQSLLVVAVGDAKALKPVLLGLPGIEQVDVMDPESLGL